LQRYGKNVDKIIITRQRPFEKRNLDGKEILFIPYAFIREIITL
jgi:hypothetical protein